MSTVSISQMKTRVLSEYPGEKWKKRVDSMPDYQIIAIYYKIINKKEQKT